MALDSITIVTNKKEHDSLILGDSFNVGLNFMSVVNTPTDEWLVDVSKVRITNNHEQKSSQKLEDIEIVLTHKG